MKLNRLQLTNFRLHTDTSIDFEAGLTGIIGPNGSGKTTILEAIAWALYGMSAVRGKRQDIRSLNASARSGVRVELDFDLAGHRHRVVRTLNTAELYLDGATAPIANSTSAVTDLLRRRLGMSQQEFFHTYFTGQKELGVMAAMGAAERSQFLSRVLGYEKLTSARSLVRERRNIIKGELTGLQSAMPESDVVTRLLNEADLRLKEAESRARAALKRLQKAVEAKTALEPKWQAAKKEREVAQQILSELRVRESEEAGLARDAERLEQELAEIVEARREVDRLSEELKVEKEVAAQLVELERLLKEEGKRKQLQKDRIALEKLLHTARERVTSDASVGDALRAAEEQRRRLRGELEETSGQREALRTDWVRDRQEAETKLQDYRAQRDDVKRQRDEIVNLGPDSPCPICTRPLGDHFREVLDELDGKLTEIAVNGKYFRNRVAQLKEMPAPLRDLETRVAQLEAEIAVADRAAVDAQLRQQAYAQLVRDVADKEQRLAAIVAELESIPAGYHETRHAQLRQQRAQLAPIVERSTRLAALVEREPKVRGEGERVKKELAKLRKHIKELRDKQGKSKFSEQAFTKLQASYDAAVADFHALQIEGARADSELNAARAARAAAETQRQELERALERLRALTVDRRLHDELDLAFTDIRATLNEHLRPELSEIASGFLSDLTDGRYTDLELDEEYNIIVKEDDIPKPVISGGEEDLAHLVLRLAISQMIAERAGQAFSLLILDEVFGSLDETRRHNVVELLRRLHDRFEQVIVITHIESVREGLDRVLTVRYDEESRRSRVEQDSQTALSLDADAGDDEYAAAGAGAEG